MFGYKCGDCGSASQLRTQRALVGTFFIVVFLVIFYQFALKPAIYGDVWEEEYLHQEEQQAKKGCLRKVIAKVVGWVKANKRLIRDHVKVIVGFYQMVSTYHTSFSTEWPAGIYAFLDHSAIARLGLWDLPWVSCVTVGASYEEKIMAYTLIPLGVCVILAVPLVVMSLSRSHKFVACIDAYWKCVVALLFILYPTVSIATIGTFNCQRVTPSLNLLVADYRESCPWDDPKGFLFGYSIFFALLYPFGIPGMAFVLFKLFKVPELAAQKQHQAQLHAMILLFIKSMADRAKAIAPTFPTNVNLTGTPGRLVDLSNSSVGESGRSLLRGRRPGGEGLVGFEGNEREEELSDGQLIALLTHTWSAVDDANAVAAENAEQERAYDGTRRTSRRNSRLGGSVGGSGGPSERKVRIAGMESLSEKDLGRCDRVQLRRYLRQAGVLLVSQGVLAIPKLEWDGSLGAPEKAAVHRLGFLMLTYEPRYWYFELLELARKLFIASVVIFIFPGSLKQVATAFAVSFLALVFNMHLQPFQSRDVMHAHTFSLTAQCVVLFYGVMLGAVKVVQGEQRLDQGDAVAAYIVVLILLCIPPVFPFLLFLNRRLHQAITRRQARGQGNNSAPSASLILDSSNSRTPERQLSQRQQAASQAPALEHNMAPPVISFDADSAQFGGRSLPAVRSSAGNSLRSSPQSASGSGQFPLQPLPLFSEELRAVSPGMFRASLTSEPIEGLGGGGSGSLSGISDDTTDAVFPTGYPAVSPPLAYPGMVGRHLAEPPQLYHPDALPVSPPPIDQLDWSGAQGPREAFLQAQEDSRVALRQLDREIGEA